MDFVTYMRTRPQVSTFTRKHKAVAHMGKIIGLIPKPENKVEKQEIKKPASKPVKKPVEK